MEFPCQNQELWSNFFNIWSLAERSEEWKLRNIGFFLTETMEGDSIMERCNHLVQRALESAVAKLMEDYGADMTKWRLPNAPIVFHPNNFLNIPQANQDEGQVIPLEMNRGTENNMTVFTPEGIVAYEVTPPGQSGFIAPDGEKSQHYADQLQMYADFGRKRMWIYTEDIDKNKSQRRH